jgi:hypothetical protein
MREIEPFAMRESNRKPRRLLPLCAPPARRCGKLLRRGDGERLRPANMSSKKAHQLGVDQPVRGQNLAAVQLEFGPPESP